MLISILPLRDIWIVIGQRYRFAQIKVILPIILGIVLTLMNLRSPKLYILKPQKVHGLHMMTQVSILIKLVLC